MSNTIIQFDSDLPIEIELISSYKTKKEWHDTLKFLFILRGKATLLIEDKLVHLVEEDICLINTNQMHEIMENNGEVLSITIQLNKLNYVNKDENVFFELCSENDTYNLKYNMIRHLLAKLVKFNISGENTYLSISILYEIFSHLLEKFRVQNPLTNKYSSKYRERIISILNYINENYTQGLTLKEVADAHNLSLSYFSTFFEKNIGTTFLSYYNDIRFKYTVNEMLSSDESLEVISYQNGFRDYRSFVNLFKKKYNTLPSDYRKDKKNEYELVQSQTVFPTQDKTLFSDEAYDFTNLARYLNIFEDHYSQIKTDRTHSRQIEGGSINYSSNGIKLNHNYRTLCCVGSARQFLYADIQQMLRLLQQEVNFKYVKFHGLLSDEMMVYKENELGIPSYSFTLIDKVIDFIMEVNLKPLIQLSFMPRDLASDPNKLIDMWNYNTSPPKDIIKWNDLVFSVISHLVERYGMEEVESWLFCVWNEPDGSLDSYGWSNAQEFYNFYKETYNTVKLINKNFQFGTPSLLLKPNNEHHWAFDFLKFCQENDCFADFFNIHYYDNSFGDNKSDFMNYFSISNIAKPCPLNVDPLAFSKFINELEINKQNLKITNQPVYLTEWNLTISHRDLINDTCFKACYLMKNLLENYDRLSSFGYWVLSDFIEELQLPNDLYHGGLGMFTYNGVPKSHYYTFKFLNQLGTEMIGKGNGYFVTKSENKITIILYNYEHFSKLFASGTLFENSKDNRYAPFAQMYPATIQMVLKNLPSQHCLIKETIVNQQYGSSYDTWVKMGSKTYLTSKELQLLKDSSQPDVQLSHKILDEGQLNLQFNLAPLEVRLVELMFK